MCFGQRDSHKGLIRLSRNSRVPETRIVAGLVVLGPSNADHVASGYRSQESLETTTADARTHGPREMGSFSSSTMAARNSKPRTTQTTERLT
jgi:hypothetical protein